MFILQPLARHHGYFCVYSLQFKNKEALNIGTKHHQFYEHTNFSPHVNMFMSQLVLIPILGRTLIF
jgi:hypothetical protein